MMKPLLIQSAIVAIFVATSLCEKDATCVQFFTTWIAALATVLVSSVAVYVAIGFINHKRECWKAEKRRKAFEAAAEKAHRNPKLWKAFNEAMDCINLAQNCKTSNPYARRISQRLAKKLGDKLIQEMGVEI